MKSIVPQVLALFVATLPLAGTAQAAFNPAVVSADARWVVHVDLNNLRDSTIGRELTAALVGMQPALQQGGLSPDFQKILTTADSLTAFGTSFSGDPAQLDGTLVVQGSPELRQIVEAFVLQASIAEPTRVVEIAGLPFEAYALQGQATIAFPKEPVILFSKSQAQLAKAYDVYRGAAPSLAKGSPALAGLLPKGGGHYLIAASVVPTDSDLLSKGGPQARVLQMANSLAISLGEEGSVTSARLHLVANSVEMADKLKRILDGMAAVLSLTQSNDAQLSEFLRSVSVERKDSQVTLALAYSSERLVQMFKDVQQGAGPRGNAGGNNRAGAPAAPAPVEGMGRVVTTWLADADLPGAAPAPGNLAVHTVDDVALKSGATITVSGRRGAGEHARVDYVEVLPTAGGEAADRYEAEFMRLNHYRNESASFASGGEIIRLVDGRDTGTASFRFQGDDGTYRITIGLVDESDGQSSFAVGVDDRTAPVGPEAPAR